MSSREMSPENEAALCNFERIVEVPTWRDILGGLVENRSGLLFCVYFGLFAVLMGTAIAILIAVN